MWHKSVTNLLTVRLFVREKSSTLPVLAQTTTATGVGPVQEQLVWGHCRPGVWHGDYRWCSGWGKLRFLCWMSEKSIVSFSFSWVAFDWIIGRREEARESSVCYQELHCISTSAAWTATGVDDAYRRVRSCVLQVCNCLNGGFLE